MHRRDAETRKLARIASEPPRLRSFFFFGSGSPVVVECCRQAAVVLWILLSAAAVLVVARRLGGALIRPLSPAALLTATLLTLAAAAVIRAGWTRRSDAIVFSHTDWLLMGWTSLAVAGLVGALCLPGTHAVWLLAVGFVVAAEEVCAWRWLLRGKRGENDFPVPKNSSDPLMGADPVAAADEEIVQLLTRRRDADGREELFGRLRAAFAPGQRTTSVHVAFCPPLEATPEVTVEQIAGPTARIKTAQVLPYGARIDLKLAAPAQQPANVLLQFSARASAYNEGTCELPL